MKKKAILVSFIVLVVFPLLGILVLAAWKKFDPGSFPKRSFEQLKASIFLEGENNENVEGPTLAFSMPQSTALHFQNLYQVYENAPNGKKFYAEHNRWKKARLTVGERQYDVRIRSHGSQPDDHRVANFISLRVKILGASPPFGVSRFRLIIYERIRNHADLMKYFANRFRLISQRHILVNVSINQSSKKLYYLEQELSNETLQAWGFGEFQVMDSDWIQASRRVPRGVSQKDLPQVYQEIESKELASIEKRLQVMKESELKTKLKLLNSKIVLKDPSSNKELFDFYYITSFEAARTLAGYWGHGFRQGNLKVLYNRKNKKFYPVIHRDNRMGILSEANSKDKDFEQFLAGGLAYFSPEFTQSKDEIELSFLHLLVKDDAIRQEKYRKIWAVVSNAQDQLEARKENSKIVKTHQNLNGNLYRFYVQMRRWIKDRAKITSLPEDILANWGHVKKLLDKSAVQIRFYKTKTTLRLSVKVDSASCLKFHKLGLPLQIKKKEKISIKGKKSLASIYDFSGLLKENCLSSYIEKDLSSQPRDYVFDFDLSGPVKLRLGLATYSEQIKMVNAVTGRLLDDSEVVVEFGSADQIKKGGW